MADKTITIPITMYSPVIPHGKEMFEPGAPTMTNPPEQQREAGPYAPGEPMPSDEQIATYRQMEGYLSSAARDTNDGSSIEERTAIAIRFVRAAMVGACGVFPPVAERPFTVEQEPEVPPAPVHSGGEPEGRNARLGELLIQARRVGNLSDRELYKAAVAVAEDVNRGLYNEPSPPEPPQQRDEAGESKPKCPDGLLPDGDKCPRCGGQRAPSGSGGGTWVHWSGPAYYPPPSPATDAGWRSKCVVEYKGSDQGWTVFHWATGQPHFTLVPRGQLAGQWVEWTMWMAYPGEDSWFASEEDAYDALASAPPPPGEPARSSVTIDRADLAWLYNEFNRAGVRAAHTGEPDRIAAALAQPPNSGDAKK